MTHIDARSTELERRTFRLRQGHLTMWIEQRGGRRRSTNHKPQTSRGEVEPRQLRSHPSSEIGVFSRPETRQMFKETRKKAAPAESIEGKRILVKAVGLRDATSCYLAFTGNSTLSGTGYHFVCGVYSVLEAASRVCLSTCSYCKGKRAMHHTMLGTYLASLYGNRTLCMLFLLFFY